MILHQKEEKKKKSQLAGNGGNIVWANELRSIELRG